MMNSNQKTNKSQVRWVCPPCGYIYDPKAGDPESGIASGTPFAEIPNDWLCPLCGIEKRQFVPENEYYT